MPLGIQDFETLDDIGAVISDLTPRERQVLRQLLDGQRKSEIGRTLGISPKTVDAHRANLLAKLGAPNTPRLIARVLAYQYARASAPSGESASRSASRTRRAAPWM
jgi:DNA-binding CsgD family transcriptional regulator